MKKMALILMVLVLMTANAAFAEEVFDGQPAPTPDLFSGPLLHALWQAAGKEKEMETVTADAGPVLTADGIPEGDWNILMIPPYLLIRRSQSLRSFVEILR